MLRKQSIIGLITLATVTAPFLSSPFLNANPNQHSEPRKAPDSPPDRIMDSDPGLSSEEIQDARQKAALDFFHDHWERASRFDASIADNYHPEALIHTLRTDASGDQKKMELSGARWKALMPAIMEAARQRGDVQKLAQVDVRETENGFRISAERYSELKCYTDKNYYMVVAFDEGRFYIVEEFMQTVGENLCESNRN